MRERAERAEYRRFLEDYEDPALWEDHKKALAARMRFPHAANRDIETMLSRLCESGYDISEKSAGEAAQVAREELEVRIDLPEDVEDLPLGERKESR